MKTSIIYSVAVSLALLSTVEIHLGKSNFDTKCDSKGISTGQSFVPKATKKKAVIFSKTATTKTTNSKKYKSTFSFVKPAIVFEEEIFVEVVRNEKQWADTNAIIEDTANDETKPLNFQWMNSAAFLEETIEMPNVSQMKGSSDGAIQQEIAIIEATDSNETQALDDQWIETLSLLEKASIVPKSDSVIETTFDFAIIGEDDALLSQPLNYHWIEALQMLEEPILTPSDLEKE